MKKCQLSHYRFRLVDDLLQFVLSFVAVISAANTLFPPLAPADITLLLLPLPPLQDIHCF